MPRKTTTTRTRKSRGYVSIFERNTEHVFMTKVINGMKNFLRSPF